MDVITMEDFNRFMEEFFDRMEVAIRRGNQDKNTEWLRSAQVRKMLNISAGTLQHLRINGGLPFTKVGGTIFYNKAEVEKILNGK